jgi:hypothetical protein
LLPNSTMSGVPDAGAGGRLVSRVLAVRSVGSARGGRGGVVYCPGRAEAPPGDHRACPAYGQGSVQAHGYGRRDCGGDGRDQRDLPACHAAGRDHPYAGLRDRRHAGRLVWPSRARAHGPYPCRGGRDDGGRCQHGAGERGQGRGKPAQAGAAAACYPPPRFPAGRVREHDRLPCCSVRAGGSGPYQQARPAGHGRGRGRRTPFQVPRPWATRMTSSRSRALSRAAPGAAWAGGGSGAVSRRMYPAPVAMLIAVPRCPAARAWSRASASRAMRWASWWRRISASPSASSRCRLNVSQPAYTVTASANHPVAAQLRSVDRLQETLTDCLSMVTVPC